MRTDERHPRVALMENERGSPVVALHLDDGGWNGNYHFATAGMTPEEIKVRHDAIVTHHQQKAARLTGLQALKPALLGFGYRIADCTIREQGYAAVRLVLRVSTSEGAIIELDRLYPTTADIPSDGEILQIARDAAAQHSAAKNMQGARAALIRGVLGL